MKEKERPWTDHQRQRTELVVGKLKIYYLETKVNWFSFKNWIRCIRNPHFFRFVFLFRWFKFIILTIYVVVPLEDAFETEHGKPYKQYRFR